MQRSRAEDNKKIILRNIIRVIYRHGEKEALRLYPEEKVLIISMRGLTYAQAKEKVEHATA